jgi:DNA repair photolyase
MLRQADSLKMRIETIYMGYQTDPYQPCEAEYHQTSKVLELFLQKGYSARILTKSDLVVRDIDILKKMDDTAVSVSVAFNDNQTRKRFEANSPI